MAQAALAIFAQTKRQMAATTGLAPGAVACLDREDEGWRIGIDRVEHRAIPRMLDLLASFEARLDEQGDGGAAGPAGGTLHHAEAGG